MKDEKTKKKTNQKSLHVEIKKRKGKDFYKEREIYRLEEKWVMGDYGRRLVSTERERKRERQREVERKVGIEMEIRLDREKSVYCVCDTVTVCMKEKAFLLFLFSFFLFISSI